MNPCEDLAWCMTSSPMTNVAQNFPSRTLCRLPVLGQTLYLTTPIDADSFCMQIKNDYQGFPGSSSVCEDAHAWCPTKQEISLAWN